MKKELARFGFLVPVEAHKKVKILCVRKGLTIGELMTNALEKTYKELEGVFTPKELK